MIKAYKFDENALAKLCNRCDQDMCPVDVCPFENKACLQITSHDWSKILCKEQNEYVFQLSAHRKVWNLLMENPHMMKVDAFEALGYDIDTENLCFACEYVKQTTDLTTDDIRFCDYCPLEFEVPCFDLRGLYHEWKDERDEDISRELAKQIRDLKVKDWVKYE